MDNSVVTVNPANEQIIYEHKNMSNEEVTKIVDRSRDAFAKDP